MPSTQPHNLDRNQYLNEAKTHLETIERGLLNLSGVVRQPETLQSLYDAAEFLNTGAVIHEMETLQQMAQFFEDCFGVMRTASVVSDKRLEDLLWRVFDTFQGLVDMHVMSEEPTEYTQGVEREVYKGLQPTLNEAKNYLKSRILHEEATVSELTPESEFFHQQVDAELKAMEELLQQENPSYYRNELEEHCQVLEQIGGQAKIPTWVQLLKTAQSAIAATENSVKSATESAIQDIREAQELIKLGEAYKIKPSQRLKAMSLQLSSPWDIQNNEEEEDNNFTIEESNVDDLDLDEKITIADLDGIPETSTSSEPEPNALSQQDDEDLNFLESLEGDFWEDDLKVDQSPEIDHSEEHLQLWDEQETIAEDNAEWWNEQETAIEDDGNEEDLDQWMTNHSSDDEDDLFQEIFASEQEPAESSDDSDELDDLLSAFSSEEEETPSNNQENEEWEMLFNSLESSSESADSENELSIFSEEAKTDSENEDSFSSWSEQTFEPLEDLEDIFTDEEEQTFIQDTGNESPLDQYGENETLIEELAQESLVSSTQNPVQYYESLENLESLIASPAATEITENFDITALKTYIEQPPRVSKETISPVSSQQEKKEAAPAQPVAAAPAAPAQQGGASLFEQTVKVPVRLMDNLNNLIGELVINRNSLEQDQERLRRFLDNLLEQVQNLNDLGVRMQDLYERSLLENSLLGSQSYRNQEVTQVIGKPGNGDESNQNEKQQEYDPLEMDRFSGFHLLSQEMIELIVRVRESSSDIEFLVDEIEEEARIFRQVTTQLQEGFTSARMVPFSQVADRLPRAVRDISLKLNKKAKLQVEGKETLVDKMILEQLYDPMTHLVNNAITHGIESPEERKQAGKPETGTIKVESHHQGNQTIISIADDGAGLDPVRIRRKAVEKGIISQAEANGLPDIDIFDFIFHPGFSTKDQADDFAGRGVGMDVVRSSLNKLRGSINIDSTPGKGTTFIIGLPLTLSITTALCCKLDQSNIAFPMDGVEDKFETSKENIKVNQKGERFIRWQKSSTLLPFKHLSELFVYNRTLTRSNVYAAQSETDEISVVVLRSTGNLVAVQVDQVLGQQEIVIKQLSGPVPKPVGIAGATVTSEGSVMAIADVLELIDLFYGRVRKDVMNSMLAQQEKAAEQEQGEAEPMVLIVDDSITVRELLSMTFTKAGYRVEQARDGKEAWEKLRAGLACDMMFCDIEMPRMDGLELLSRMKQEERFADLPVGMLTSRGADRHRQMASRLGAKGYFTKPYLEEVLLDAAKRMLKGENMMNRKANV
ncbi:MAG: response regulator [Halothece sp.]